MGLKTWIGPVCVRGVSLSKTIPVPRRRAEMCGLLLGACLCVSWYYLSLCATALRHRGVTYPEKESSATSFSSLFLTACIRKPQLYLNQILLTCWYNLVCVCTSDIEGFLCVPVRADLALPCENQRSKPGFSCSCFCASGIPMCEMAIALLGLEWRAVRVC